MILFMKRCNNCGTILLGEGTTCDCSPSQAVTVQVLRPKVPHRNWLVPALVLIMGLLLAKVVLKSQLKPAPGNPGVPGDGEVPPGVDVEEWLTLQRELRQ